MKKRKTYRTRAFVLIVLMMLSLQACDTNDANGDGDQTETQLQALRAAVAPYQDIETAKAAGYTIDIPGIALECLNSTSGGMGFHFGSGALIPNADLSVTEPEVLIYEPQADGSLEFVGVEFVVPFSIVAKTEEPPTLFGREFQPNERFNVWALHAWVGRENPSGTFKSYNPNVSCAYASGYIEKRLAWQLDKLSKSVEKYDDIKDAKVAGYTVSIPSSPKECLKDPAKGGMGFHFGNGILIPNADLSVTEPEVLIYEPQADGSLEFVGVEFVIPFTIVGKDQAPPILFATGEEFQPNERFNVWALHAWVGRDNPNGTFTSYNPDVSCQYADAYLGK